MQSEPAGKTGEHHCQPIAQATLERTVRQAPEVAAGEDRGQRGGNGVAWQARQSSKPGSPDFG